MDNSAPHENAEEFTSVLHAFMFIFEAFSAESIQESFQNLQRIIQIISCRNAKVIFM